MASLLGLVLAFGAACSAPSGQGAVGPTAVSTPPPAPSPTPAATNVPVSNAPVPTPDPRQQAFGLHSPLPLSGEFAVTGNADDRTLSVVPIGAAAVATTVQLDLAPRAIGAAPNSDTVLAADDSPDSHLLAVASLNSSSESGTIDVGTTKETVAAPPPSGTSGQLLLVSDADNSIRSVDPTTHELGAPQPLGAGPHAVYDAGGNSMLTPQVYVANVGDGTITVLDQKLSSVQSTMSVGGKPVGLARTVDGHLWVADADSGDVSMFDTAGGGKLQTIQVGPRLFALAATPDGHFLALASDTTLYAVDLVSGTIGSSSTSPVHKLEVPSGVLALATGAEITRAYATTGDGNLIYFDLESNSISQTIPVGHKPVALTLGLVEPSGGVSVPQGAGTTGGGGASGATGGAGTTSSAGSAGTGATTGTGTGTTSSTGGTGTTSSTGGTGTNSSTSGTGSTSSNTGVGSTSPGGTGTNSSTGGTGSTSSTSGTGSTSPSGTGSTSSTSGVGSTSPSGPGTTSSSSTGSTGTTSAPSGTGSSSSSTGAGTTSPGATGSGTSAGAGATSPNGTGSATSGTASP